MHGVDEYFTVANIIRRLQAHIQMRAEAGYQTYLLDYYKHVMPVRGIRVLELRAALSIFLREWAVEQQSIPLETERQVAFQLLCEDMMEDKLCALEFLAETLIPANKVTYRDLPEFDRLFRHGCLYSYRISDSFAQKVLTPLLLKNRVEVLRTIQTWFSSTSLWQARAALGAVAAVAADGVYEDAILQGCEILVRRPEDEAKSCAGSALKNVAKHRPRVVEAFLMRREVLKYFDASTLQKAAYQHLAPGVYDELKKLRKEVAQKMGSGTGGDAGAGPSVAEAEASEQEVEEEEVEEQQQQQQQVGEGEIEAGQFETGGDPFGMEIGDPLGMGLAGEFGFAGGLEQGLGGVGEGGTQGQGEEGTQSQGTQAEVEEEQSEMGS